ncbi:uncharacterized protein LOC128182874 [Crassostrea angulata]|uniref:uncharacterized protein LOC128182874 n=1 Tax=Magallana angulata TaxID=2784310 RepID=UPI0022B137C0|nr:uncharacterized protein LOC128182874 [Crassostrea angulata]
MILLMLFIFSLTGSRVQSLSWKYVYDFVVEGGSLPVSVIQEESDPAELYYSLLFECPTTCNDGLNDLVSIADNSGSGFIIKTTDNELVEPLFDVVVIVGDKTAENKELQRLRFKFIDNDDPDQTTVLESVWSTILLEVVNPPNLPGTVYTVVDVMDQNFRKQWYVDPLQVEFKENETGNKSILVRPVEDNTVDGDQQYVLVTKRMSTDEGIARYHSHRIVNVLDNDVYGQWTEWSMWSECSNTPPFCYQRRTRTCKRPPSVLNGNPVCDGQSSESKHCPCFAS